MSSGKMYSFTGRRGDAWTATKSGVRMRTGRLPRNFHRLGPAGDVRVVLELLPRPEARLLGAAVEVVRLVEDGEVVVAHQRRPAALA